jgi:hypothetical protein
MEYRLFRDSFIGIWERTTLVVKADDLKQAVTAVVNSDWDKMEVYESEYLYDTQMELEPSPEIHHGLATEEIMVEDTDDILWNNKDDYNFDLIKEIDDAIDKTEL